MISDRALWLRAKAHFDELVELADDARAVRLDELGREDPVLRDSVRHLLDADRSANRALLAYRFAPSHDANAEADTDPSNPRDPLGIVGRTVSHFRVTDFVAAGGMGVVYAAEDLQLRRTVALKFPLPHQDLGREVMERFLNEARSAAALDHPNLCPVLEIGESENGVYLAMPLYPGETLRARLGRDGAVPPDATLDIVAKVVSGLVAAHAAGIVHRDLKPGNVMLLPDGAVKVLDFGLAKVRDVDLTKSRRTLGTIGYVAPEQVRGGAVDARTDLWAIGVMLYEMLTGTLPFRGDHEMAVLHAVLHDEPRPPSAVRAGLPLAFDDIVGALLQKQPASRYQSADALLVDLAALQRGGPLTLRAPYWSRTSGRRRVRRALPAASVVAVLALAAAGVAVAGRSLTRDASSTPGAGALPALKWRGDTAEVANGAELMAALVPAHAGRHLRLRAGTFEIDRALVVPDRMTITGAGVMRFGDDGLPAGFREGTSSTIRMTSSTGGEVVSLGDGVTLRNIEIADLDGRSGNVVAVVSRRPQDRITATIVETVIVNPNQLALSAGGSAGRGLFVVTLNPNMAAAPAPHEGSELSVSVQRSLIRSPVGGGGFFAFNFAPRSRIALDISQSVIGGGNEANGGVSRPDEVRESDVRIISQGNLYRSEWADPCATSLTGWNLSGGSGAPIPIPNLPATTRNRLVVRSTNDRLEGFTTSILATGSRRFFSASLNAAPSDNHIDLQLLGTTISSPTCRDRGANTNTTGTPGSSMRPVADLRFFGAFVERASLEAGDRNTLRVELRGVTASGRRDNLFVSGGSSDGEPPARYRGTGNRLEIVGDPQSFARENRGIDPGPDARYFLRGRPGTRGGAMREPVSSTNPKNGANPP